MMVLLFHEIPSFRCANVRRPTLKRVKRLFSNSARIPVIR